MLNMNMHSPADRLASLERIVAAILAQHPGLARELAGGDLADDPVAIKFLNSASELRRLPLPTG